LKLIYVNGIKKPNGINKKIFPIMFLNAHHCDIRLNCGAIDKKGTKLKFQMPFRLFSIIEFTLLVISEKEPLNLIATKRKRKTQYAHKTFLRIFF